MRSRPLVLGLCLLAGLAWVHAQAPAPSALSKRDADAMEKKLATIVLRGNMVPPKKAPPAQRTSFTDTEVNSYFKYIAPPLLPVGVEEPRVVIDEGGRLRARAMVNLDAVRTSKVRSMLDPMNYITGTLELTAAGTLQASNGKGTFAIETATLGGLPIPKTLLQEVIYYYSRTPESPNGFNLDAPFELPVKIQSVELRRGGATVVQ
jgi:hypothetical protein